MHVGEDTRGLRTRGIVGWLTFCCLAAGGTAGSSFLDDGSIPSSCKATSAVKTCAGAFWWTKWAMINTTMNCIGQESSRTIYTIMHNYLPRFLCHIIRLLPFLPSPSMLETKVEDRVYNIIAFYAGTRLDRGAEERTYGTLGHGVCNRGKKGYSGVTKEPCYKCAEGAGGRNWPKRKNVPKTLILR